MIKTGYLLQLTLGQAYSGEIVKTIDGLEYAECLFLIAFSKLFINRREGGLGYSSIDLVDFEEVYAKFMNDFEEKYDIKVPANYRFTEEDPLYDLFYDVIGTGDGDYFRGFESFKVYFVESPLYDATGDFK